MTETLCAKIVDESKRYMIFRSKHNEECLEEFKIYMGDVMNQKAIIKYLRSINIE